MVNIERSPAANSICALCKQLIQFTLLNQQPNRKRRDKKATNFSFEVFHHILHPFLLSFFFKKRTTYDFMYRVPLGLTFSISTIQCKPRTSSFLRPCILLRFDRTRLQRSRFGYSLKQIHHLGCVIKIVLRHAWLLPNCAGKNFSNGRQ